jgi:hypothetical protein
LQDTNTLPQAESQTPAPALTGQVFSANWAGLIGVFPELCASSKNPKRNFLSQIRRQHTTGYVLSILGFQTKSSAKT